MTEERNECKIGGCPLPKYGRETLHKYCLWHAVKHHHHIRDQILQEIDKTFEQVKEDYYNVVYSDLRKGGKSEETIN